MVDFIALKAEITNDPLTLGYAAHVTAGRDIQVANLLNMLGRTVDRVTVSAQEIVQAIVPSEYTSLVAVERDRLAFMLLAGQLSVKNTNVRAAFLLIFGAGTASRAALGALQTRNGSRAEELFGEGTVITSDQVAQAIRGTV